MCRQQGPKRVVTDFAVGELSPQQSLEMSDLFGILDSLDLGNQAIEPQSDGRVGHAVLGSDLLQRSRRQNKPSNKGQIFVTQVLKPLPVRHNITQIGPHKVKA